MVEQNFVLSNINGRYFKLADCKHWKLTKLSRSGFVSCQKIKNKPYCDGRCCKYFEKDGEDIEFVIKEAN